ncbi:Hypothetical protein SynRCC307_1772 [Synechococcus sp. RCC307]|nr:Hypothetical protein SynRCC307_1772 [Synechococcus sp. RCC307]
MDADQANTSIDIQVIDKMMDRWRLRLLTHGASSELGMEATRQLSKLEARKEHLSAQS